MTNWPRGYLMCVYEFLYKKRDIEALLKIISDKNKFQEDIIYKFSNYKNLHTANRQYLRENFKECIEYNTFASDSSVPCHFREGPTFQNWMLAYSNVIILKELDYMISAFHSLQHYHIEDTSSFGYHLSMIDKRVNNYIEGKGYDTGLGVNVINYQYDKRDKKQMSKQELYSLLQLAKVAVVKAAIKNSRE
ncbi:hypothetical protein [Candidatus Mesenet endosymbiont of Phosphuga atrata]|uniref:hypothetical protein n=1 Tax=Candidatus Mesenet endosymbiont of Phosphuga atrata TaxID=3066221 RepID=UPI0030CA922C